MARQQEKKRIIVVGGGFSGLEVAKGLCRLNCEVLLIDQKNHHLFQPLLYQIATASLSPADIAVPLRHVLASCKNVEVILGELIRVDPSTKTVYLKEGHGLQYDYLVLATGSTHSYFGHDEWGQHAPGLKSIEDSIEIRKRILLAFEEEENREIMDGEKSPLQFVIIGGGPTGVELAGAIAELAQKTLVEDYRQLNTRNSRVLLIEAMDRLLPAFHSDLSEKARRSLEQLGVQVLLKTFVVDVKEKLVLLKNGERLAANAIIWAAGVKASPVAQWLGVAGDKMGRVSVDAHCRLPQHPEIFVVGDAAHFEHGGAPLPGVAPVAIQQGRYAARALRNLLSGKALQPFHYSDKGSLATIGRNRAVAQFGKLRLSGFGAWILWATVHIMYLVGFRNRVFVFFSWAWSYLDFHRGARLITYPSGEADSSRAKTP
jgi:NADH dehydrogenase